MTDRRRPAERAIPDQAGNPPSNADDNEAKIGRRAASALLFASVMAGCTPRTGARAQQPGRPGPQSSGQRPGALPAVVLPVPMPCTDRPGDVCALVLEGSGAPAGTVTVFGQAFRPGDVPRGAALAARLAATGETLAVQMDVATRHPDGSVRFAVLALAAPALRDGERSGVVLSTRSTEAAAAVSIDLSAALSGRSVVVEVTPEGGGTSWQIDLARQALAARERPWQAGPLALQVRIEIRVPPAAVGGATSMRLVADLAVRADGSLWVDPWFRNDIAQRPGGGTATYALRVTLDGREALATDGTLRQWQYSGWGRLLGAASDGTRLQPPRVIHDPAYLADTAAIARYDLTTGVEEAFLQRMAQSMAAADWDVPLRPRGITTRMGTTGGRPDLGLTTQWQAAWIIAGDNRAAAFCIGQGEAAGSIPWHFWDPVGGTNGQGGWMDERRWPQLWVDNRGGAPPRGLLQKFVGSNADWGGWQVDMAHQPSLSYVPFLLTGRRAFLDNILAQVSHNVLAIWPALRSYDETAPIRGVNVANAYQVRSSAWNVRELDSAAWICPDGDQHQTYLREVLAANWSWLRSRIPEWTALQGEVHGYRMGYGFGYEPHGQLAPWQQDYFASVTAMAARRGSADARAFLTWMSNFIVRRFLVANQGFSPNDGAAYTFAITPLPPAREPSSPQIYTTWAQIGAATRERGLSNGEGWARSNGEYARLALLSLAVTIEVLDTAEARAAYAWLISARAPFTDLVTFTRMPGHNIVPKGQPRVPERAPQCVPASGSRD